MSDGKVIRLADKRRQHLGVLGVGHWLHYPIKASWFDAWAEPDGSIVLRIDASRVTFEKGAIVFGDKAFEARGEAYEFRVAAVDVEPFKRDVSHVAHTSRVMIERRRGDHLWRCQPLGDGRYEVDHERRKAIFEPFKPRLRKHREKGERAMRAPSCAGCGRVVQIGETMWRDAGEKHAWGTARTFGRDALCKACVEKPAHEGIAEVGT